ncbi:hypothetical protein BH10BAC3_BH10BAC3_05910 [soil metagenome]
MNTVNIKLYDIARLKLKLNEADAKEFVQAIDEVIADELKSSTTDFKSLWKEDFKTLDSKIDKESGRLELKIEQSKNDTVRWLFGFWVTLVLLMLANWFFKK